MEAEARRKTFSQHLETLRRQGRRPDLSEIARLGFKSGLTSREILLEIQDFLVSPYTQWRNYRCASTFYHVALRTE
jgi:hypothetical protein